MEKHHADSIRNLTAAFERDASVLALILGGSIAHGFARPDSDIDVAMVVETGEYEKRKLGKRLHYNNKELCTYEKGYIDGKYIDPPFLKTVAERGSEPARFAFKDARVLFSRLEGLEAMLAEITRYPAAGKRERIERFAAQLFAWRWYYGEGLRLENQYLVILALQKLVLFGGRIVLALNDMLFPFHKWFLRVLERAPRKPPDFMRAVAALLADHSREKVEAYCRTLFTFAGVDAAAAEAAWPTRFMLDTELRWTDGEPGIDDL